MLMVSPAAATVFDDVAESAWSLDALGRARAIVSTPTAVYVGGQFASVDDGVGGPATAQPHLAAFDPVTGDWLPGFRPQLNGAVQALATSDDGSRLFIGGAFTQVNGSPISGLVELDPTTGATISSIETGTSGVVYDLDVVGDTMYVVGNLSWVGGVRVRGAGSIDLTTGLADPEWTPSLANGSGRAVAAQASSDRVYIGGFFTSANGDPSAAKLVAVDGATGGNDPHFDPGDVEEVFDIAVTVDKLYIAHGGPGGRGDVRDPVSGRLLVTHVTDGDVQSVAVSDERVFFGHHGERVDGADRPWVYAIDRADDSVDTTFAPDITGVAGYGVWAVHDAGDHLWVGGGIDTAAPVAGTGILRFPSSADQPIDVGAPTTPAALAAPVVGDDEVQLDWDASIDDSGAVYYRIRRDGVLVGTSVGLTFVDVTAVPATTVTYTVEAVDAAQNVSAGAQLAVVTLPPLADLVAFDLGGTWRYLDDAVPAVGWNLAGFDDAAWELGVGQFGRGDGDEATLLDHPVAPSVTVFFRAEFDIPVGSTAVIATLDYVRDDGVIVRVNGVEVLRDNLPSGAVDETTRAVVWESGNESNVFSVPIDATPFVEGTNAITVELHNASSGGDLSFDAGLRIGLVDDTRAPTAPGGLQVTGVTQSDVSLSWAASTDDQGVAGYDVLRDGAVVGFSPTTSHVDSGLSASVDYSYEVRALDAAGNQSPLSSPVVATTSDFVPDLTPPSIPTALAAPIVTESSVALTWTPSTDDVGVTGYELWRDGTLIASVASASHVDSGLSSSTAYAYSVVAFDAAGNRSALTAALEIITADAAPRPAEVIAFGSSWAYDDGGVYPGAGWALPGFDDLSWPRGVGDLGTGNGDDTTVVTNQPTVWLRAIFDVDDPAAVLAFDIDLMADDGAVVFVNGVEVLRDNVGAGPVDGSTAAAGYRWGAAEDLARPFSLPTGVLAGGQNVLAVALVNGPGSSDLSFDLRAVLTVGHGGAADVAAPSQPTVVLATNVTPSSLQLSWTASIDDTAVAGYHVYRDGTPVATVTGSTFNDSDLVAGTDYAYEVEAFDAAGNRSVRSTVLVVTTSAMPPVESDLLAMGSVWRYLDGGAYPGVSWVDVSFDDALWSSGPAVLAAGEPGATGMVNQPTVWLRTTMNVTSAAAVVQLEADIRADDGVVVFVNGVEVLRDNVDAGPVDGSTAATTYRWGAAERAVRSFTLPVGVLVDGTNVIAVALVNAPGSGDASFDLGVRHWTLPE